MIRKLLRVVLGGFLLWVGANLLFALAVAFPAAVFAHEYRHGDLTLYSDRSHNQAAAQGFLQQVSDTLAESVLGPPEKPYEIFASGGWRAALFFLPVRQAGSA